MDTGVHDYCKRRPMCDQLCPMCTPWQPLTREECDKMQADLVEQMKRTVREPYYGKHIILPLPKEPKA